MRISATDRIIREAQQHDSAAVDARADEHPDTDKVSGPPLLSFGLSASRPSRSFGDAHAGFDDGDEDDEEAYEEGETQVDAKRSAAALDQMRALQDEGKLTPPPVRTRRSGRHHGLPPGRPGGGAKLGLVPPVASPGFPQTMLMFAPAARAAAAMPSDPPRLATPAPAAQPAAPSHQPLRRTEDRFDAVGTATQSAPLSYQPPRRTEDRFDAVGTATQSAPLTYQSPRRTEERFDAVMTPTPAPLSLGRQARVGRRAGFAIAATTAIAVTVILGSWTDRERGLTQAVVAHPADVTAPVVKSVPAAAGDEMPGRPSAGLVAEPPEAPVAPAPSAPLAVSPPAPSPALVAASVPVETPAAVSTDDSNPVPKRSSKHAQAAASSAKVMKARLAKKKAVAMKKNVRAPRPNHAAGVSGGRSSAGLSPRVHSDPDDTLPISN